MRVDKGDFDAALKRLLATPASAIIETKGTRKARPKAAAPKPSSKRKNSGSASRKDQR